MTDIRRPKDAATPLALWQYYETRALQLLQEGFSWNGRIEWAAGFEGRAVRTFFESNDGSRWVSFFVLPGARGQGVMRALATSSGYPVITVDDCDLAPVLEHLGVRHHVAGAGLLDSVEYRLIEQFYGNQKSARSQVFLMNHIDEGLAVMRWIGATGIAARAFCLHPLLQNDADVEKNFADVAAVLRLVPDGIKTMAMAMEYRSVANEYLAHCELRSGGIRLSPLHEVNTMLVGDKVQNRKDFELHHAGTHANSLRLAEYFDQWCQALGVAGDAYARLKARLPGKRIPQQEVAPADAT